jgi:cytochrome c-type biogenesis protein CcmH
MSRWLGWIAIAWLLGLCALALAAYGNPAHSASLAERTRAVAQQLRCPVCQGESVADSPSAISQAMRAIIRQRLARGETPEQVKAYLVSRYGNWILLAPPASGIGSLAWLAPPLLLLGGLVLLAVLVLDWRARSQRRTSGAKREYLERVRAELENYEP